MNLDLNGQTLKRRLQSDPEDLAQRLALRIAQHRNKAIDPLALVLMKSGYSFVLEITYIDRVIRKTKHMLEPAILVDVAKYRISSHDDRDTWAISSHRTFLHRERTRILGNAICDQVSNNHAEVQSGHDIGCLGDSVSIDLNVVRPLLSETLTYQLDLRILLPQIMVRTAFLFDKDEMTLIAKNLISWSSGSS